MSHPIRQSSVGKRSATPYQEASAPPQWPSYTGNAQLVGTSPSGKVTVYVDPTLDDHPIAGLGRQVPTGPLPAAQNRPTKTAHSALADRAELPTVE